MKKELTCVVFPVGCRITSEIDGSGTISSVSGNTCPRGMAYAESELKHPVRTLTTSVRISGAAHAVMLPVKTSRPIPKELLLPAMDVIHTVSVASPIHLGDVLIENFMEEGTNLVACKTIA